MGAHVQYRMQCIMVDWPVVPSVVVVLTRCESSQGGIVGFVLVNGRW